MLGCHKSGKGFEFSMYCPPFEHYRRHFSGLGPAKACGDRMADRFIDGVVGCSGVHHRRILNRGVRLSKDGHYYRMERETITRRRRLYMRKPTFTMVEVFDPNIIPWPRGIEERDWFCNNGYKFKLPHGFDVTIRPGDYVVTFEDGTRHPVQKDFFEMLYRPVNTKEFESIVGDNV
jgi:hypothetical protein